MFGTVSLFLGVFIYCKSSIRAPGAYLFQSHLRGDLIETGAYLKGGGLFNLEKTMVSVLHKKPRIQSGNAQVQEVEGHAAEDQRQIRTSSW